MRRFAGFVMLVAGMAGATWSLTLVLAPLPAPPWIDKPDLIDRGERIDSAEVTAARAKLYEAQLRHYREQADADALKLALRPPWARVWPVYLVVAVLFVLGGLVELGFFRS